MFVSIFRTKEIYVFDIKLHVMRFIHSRDRKTDRYIEREKCESSKCSLCVHVCKYLSSANFTMSRARLLDRTSSNHRRWIALERKHHAQSRQQVSKNVSCAIHHLDRLLLFWCICVRTNPTILKPSSTWIIKFHNRKWSFFFISDEIDCWPLMKRRKNYASQ